MVFGGETEGYKRWDVTVAHWFAANRYCLLRIPQSFCPNWGKMTVACGRPGRGSDSPPDCHSLPRLRFAYPLGKGALGAFRSATARRAALGAEMKVWAEEHDR